MNDFLFNSFSNQGDSTSIMIQGIDFHIIIAVTSSCQRNGRSFPLLLRQCNDFDIRCFVQIKPINHHLSFSFIIHIVPFRNCYSLQILSACQLTSARGSEVLRITGNDGILQIMFSSLFQQKLTGLCCIMMPPIGFVNSIANVPADIQPFIMSDPQITLTYLCSIRETDGKVIGRYPVFLRLRVTGSVKAKKKFRALQIIHRIKLRIFLVMVDLFFHWNSSSFFFCFRYDVFNVLFNRQCSIHSNHRTIHCLKPLCRIIFRPAVRQGKPRCFLIVQISSRQDSFSKLAEGSFPDTLTSNLFRNIDQHNMIQRSDQLVTVIAFYCGENKSAVVFNLLFQQPYNFFHAPWTGKGICRIRLREE